MFCYDNPRFEFYRCVMSTLSISIRKNNIERFDFILFFFSKTDGEFQVVIRYTSTQPCNRRGSKFINVAMLVNASQNKLILLANVAEEPEADKNFH